MSGAKYEIRPVEESDGPSVVELRRRVTDLPLPEKNDISFWRWENLDNPYGHALAMLAVHEGLAVSNFALLPRIVRVNGQRHSGCLSVESMTDRRYRGKGFFPRLWTALEPLALESGVELFYGFPNPNSRPIFQRAFRWSDVGGPDLFLYPLCPDRLLAARGMPLTAVARPVGSLYRGIFSLRASDRVLSIEKFDAAFQPLLDQYHASAPSTPERSLEYLTWRYTGVPGRSYLIHRLEIPGESAVPAFAVTRRTRHEGIELAVVMELIVSGSTPSSQARSLVSSILAQARQSGAEAVLALAMPGDPVRGLLLRSGFLRVPHRLSPQRFHLMIHTPAGSPLAASLADPTAWRISFGDIDVF